MHPKPVGGILEDVLLIGGIYIGHDFCNRSRLAIFSGRDFRAKFQFPLANANSAAKASVESKFVAERKKGGSWISGAGATKKRKKNATLTGTLIC